MIYSEFVFSSDQGEVEKDRTYPPAQNNQKENKCTKQWPSRLWTHSRDGTQMRRRCDWPPYSTREFPGSGGERGALGRGWRII